MAKSKVNYRQEELKRRLGSAPHEETEMEPKMVEMEVDVDTQDFEGALDEVISKTEALVAMAPEEKADKLQEVLELLKNCKAGYPDEDVEAPAEDVEGGANEVPPIQLG